MHRLRGVAAALAWLVAVLAISFGAAGIVAATAPSAERDLSPSMQHDGDAAATAALDAVDARLTAVAEDLDALGTHARGALAAMVARQPDTVEAAIADGDVALARIATGIAGVEAALAAVPHIAAEDAELHVSPAVIDRYQRLAATRDATSGLEASWARLTTGAAAAGRLADQLAEHDRLVAEAAARGRDAKYKGAIASLKAADAVLDDARASRDTLAATVDVSTLDQWLDRNDRYDAALSDLYDALASVGGKVTDRVRKAIEAEKTARASLPPDARGLVLIMSDIGRGGLNEAVVKIEEAKAALAEAVAPEPSESPGSTAAPTP